MLDRLWANPRNNELVHGHGQMAAAECGTPG